jgi:hypothetical protein
MNRFCGCRALKPMCHVARFFGFDSLTHPQA